MVVKRLSHSTLRDRKFGTEQRTSMISLEVWVGGWVGLGGVPVSKIKANLSRTNSASSLLVFL